MAVHLVAAAILLCSSFNILQAGCRQLPGDVGHGRRLLATPPPKAGMMLTPPSIKFNGTHIQLPFAPPGFNGTIVCPGNGTHPPGPPRPPMAVMPRMGARPPHGAEPSRPPRAATPPAPPGALPFMGQGMGGPRGGPDGGPDGRHGPPEPTLVNVTGALNASLPILAYNGTGPLPHPCPGMDGPGGPGGLHGGPHGGPFDGPDGGPFDGPGGFRNAPPGSPMGMMGGPGALGGPDDGPGGSRGGGGGGGGPEDGGPGGRGGPGGGMGGFGH